jgi:hypothetical protein
MDVSPFRPFAERLTATRRADNVPPGWDGTTCWPSVISCSRCFEEHLVKPLDVEQLAALLERL